MIRLHNPALEQLPPADLRRLQTEKLKQQLTRVYNDSPYYFEKFNKAGVKPANFSTLEQLAEYPFFDKDEERASQETSLREAGHPLGMHITCDLKAVRRISSSSGTTGTPTFSGFTQKDRDITVENMARLMARVGLKEGDTVMHAGVLSMWVAGLPPLDALMGAGACVIPMGALSGMERLAQIAAVTHPKAVLCTPSFAIHLGRQLLERTGIEPRTLGIEKFLVFGEPGGSVKEIYEEIADSFGGADTFDVMGATGCHSPVGISCEEHAGIHYFAADNAYFEIVDPATMQPLPLEDGVEGEIVFTGLDKECAPQIRWRDKDIIRVTTTPCRCGRPGIRMMFKGRVDDMLLVKGVNVFPNAVRDVINRVSPLTTGNIRIVKDSAGPVVQAPVRIKVEVRDEATEAELAALGSQLEQAIHHQLRFRSQPLFIRAADFEVRSGATGKTHLTEVAGE
ncbi:MAG: hypothetical protein KDE59_07045 [Anaerolineales bacterium]|nr:hypothetical protein [Anaerolineales bacterium]